MIIQLIFDIVGEISRDTEEGWGGSWMFHDLIFYVLILVYE